MHWAADVQQWEIIKAGTSDRTVLAMNSYWSNGDDLYFWLRSPHVNGSYQKDYAYYAKPGHSVGDSQVDYQYAVQPASNLNLSSVLFASAATAASSDAKSGIIADGTAMTLRLDGTGKNIGAAIYNAEAGTIEVRRGSTSQTVALIVQGNDGTKDWYYSKKVDTSETINASYIKSALGLTSDIDLSVCKIWLEITDPFDGMIYAVSADKEIKQINATYVTKEQLMNSFKPYSDGTAVNVGKLVFGKNSSGTAQEWYILGQDTGVSGDNTLIFAASPIATNQKFEDDWQNKKTELSLWSDCDYNGVSITEVFPNHYGASDLRGELQSMAANETYFTAAEQGLMNDTTVTTTDTNNSATYTTTDTLYALAADGYGSSYTTIKAGTNNQTILAEASYWRSGSLFWLRSPGGDDYRLAFIARPGDYVCSYFVKDYYAVQPASNLNLSSVLFASSATAASSGAVSRTIASDAAMTLRLDGSSKDIGTVTYNTATGDIKAAKGSTEGNVALVVQGRGTVGGVEKDWYYSKQITGTDVVNVSDIVAEANTPASINLSDCNIWLETTDSTENLIYAVGATEILSITSVEITGIEAPTANTTLDTEAACATTGVSSTTPQITWAPNHSTAGYNTSYTASITLTADTGYEFINSTTATVLGNNATSVSKNADGTTLTVTYAFSATAKRVIGSVTAPIAPANNTFTTYYGYDGYDASPISGSNSELGGAATVTFTDSVNPNTESMAVTWTIANDGGAAYDKTPGVENTFRWTIPASALTTYNAADCQGYDDTTGTITGIVTIKNKAATPVTITGRDSSVAYTGETIDVSPYFTIDSHAGTATYSLVTGTDGGTGKGTLTGSTLTVTKTGTFKIKVNTAANGIYGAGEEAITLTVNNGTIEYTATDYSGTYDGQPHSISVNVTKPEGTIVTYRTDGTTYGDENPSFTNEGTYTVYYRITKDNYDTINGSKTVTISKKAITITAEDQSIMWSNALAQSKYAVSENGLATGDSIAEITLTPSTTDRTENGTISVSGVKIVNASSEDVTGNYDITPVSGALKITHNTTLAPDRIEAEKTQTAYRAGDTLNVDDLTVTAYYADGYSEEVTDYTTNAASIDMSQMGEKTLTVSYTKNGGTKTENITITVSHNTALPLDRIEATKTKTVYTAGDALNVDDLTVTAYYADGYSEKVTDYTTNAASIDMSHMGEKTLTVSYTKNGGTKTENITITVSHNTALPLDRIEATKNETAYRAGETLNVDDLTVTAYYADGYSKAVTGFTTNAADIDMSTVGQKTLTVSYTENGVTKTKDITITVNAEPATPDNTTPAKDPGLTGGDWKLDDGKWWYAAADNSYPANGWTKIEGEWYAFDAAGYMETGWYQSGNDWYYLGSSGAMETGWVSDGDTWYYMDNSGVMETGWVSDGDTWYYMNESGAMQTGWVSDGDTWYYMSESGAMCTGWVWDGANWYYMDASGAMQTGWIWDGANWYYMYSNGAMAHDVVIGGYRLSASGAWVE